MVVNGQKRRYPTFFRKMNDVHRQTQEMVKMNQVRREFIQQRLEVAVYVRMMEVETIWIVVLGRQMNTLNRDPVVSLLAN